MHHPTVQGTVIQGSGLGRALGYPTAKLALADRCDVALGIYPVRNNTSPRCGAGYCPEQFTRGYEYPAGISNGIYSAWVMMEGGKRPALFLVGTEEDHGQPSHEVHLLDWSGDLYGKTLDVEVGDKIAEIERFETREELIRKIEKDIVKAREFFKSQ